MTRQNVEPPSDPLPRGTYRALRVALVCAAVATAVAVGAARASGAACSTLTYDLDASAPSFVAEDVALAVEEIRDRTGLALRPAEEHELGDIRIRWVASFSPWFANDPQVGDSTVVAHANGLLRDAYGRRVSAAGVELLASQDWGRGLDQGTDLAAVVVHELGHVVGLGHSSAPFSFMHSPATSGPPRWTEGELAALAEVGRGANCSPGST